MKARRLSTLAEAINKSGKFLAMVEPGYCNTDRDISGTRLRRPGKGRRGNRIIVRDLAGKIVLDHNAAETYRYNGEVERWIKEKLGKSGSEGK